MIRAFQRPTQKYYATLVLQAIKTGQRPSAQILRDPYAGHRLYEHGWVPNPATDTLWTEDDYLLVEAVTAMDSLMAPTGYPRWITEDPDVFWDISESVDYSVQQRNHHAEGYKDGVPDELTISVKNPTKRGDKPFWTLEEWLENVEKDEAPRIDRDAPEGGHFPEPEELALMMAERQARIELLRAQRDQINAEGAPVELEE